MAPAVSIITPTFNRHALLKAQTAIVTAQTLCNGNATNSWVHQSFDLSAALGAFHGLRFWERVADPTGRHQSRYWDGARWTDYVADNGRESRDPLP